MKRQTLSCAPIASIAVLSALPALAADHREAPIIQEDLSADIADVYAFVSPNDPDRLVLALTVNGFSAPSENITFNFSPNVRYSFMIDNTGDAKPDASVQLTFSDRVAGPQTYTVKVTGVDAFTGDVTPPSEELEPNEPIITNGPEGIMSFAGQRDDPFFFDVVGFFRFLAGTGSFTGSDGFAGFNVSAAVVELPLELVAGGTNQPIQVWGTTERRHVTVRPSAGKKLEMHVGPWDQIERMGNPAINTALIPLDKKDLFNYGQPHRDGDDFGAMIVASLQSLGTDEKNIGILASVAVPDTLKLDPFGDAGYPNGRRPQDDVIDTLFFFIFNQVPVSDDVDGNDAEFLDDFPYLASPHQPE